MAISSPWGVILIEVKVWFLKILTITVRRVPEPLPPPPKDEK